MNFAERDSRVIWHPYTQHGSEPRPVPIVKGKGALLWDENGKEYIDAIASWWVNIHGHAHPYIIQKVSDQLQLLEQVIFAGFTHAPAVELAERLLKHLPPNQQKIFFSDNGSTAVEVALKMAFQYWHNLDKPRTGLVAFQHAYHGDTFGAMSVGARSLFNEPFTPFLFGTYFIDVPVKGREESSLNALKKYFEKEGERAAAFIFEPLVLGSGGMRMYEAAVLDEMIRICRTYDVLTIADEVMTGFGRTGQWFASDHLTEKADIFCFSKGLTGGTLPMGVTSCTSEIYNAFLSGDKRKMFFHGHSYTANPLACTAALASMDLLEKEACWQQIKKIEDSHRMFSEKINLHKQVKEVRACGTILALEIATGAASGYLDPVRDKIYNYALEKGVILRPLGNVVYVMPPYCITDEQLQKVYRIIEEALDELG